MPSIPFPTGKTLINSTGHFVMDNFNFFWSDKIESLNITSIKVDAYSKFYLTNNGSTVSAMYVNYDLLMKGVKGTYTHQQGNTKQAGITIDPDTTVKLSFTELSLKGYIVAGEGGSYGNAVGVAPLWVIIKERVGI